LLTLRNYQDLEDIHRQNAFWMQATRGLPWCWKPTNSPILFSKGAQFDPRSRCFAFEGDRLVGYMSFTGQGEFVSLGYPWVLPGYEGELQEELYDAVYGFAASPEYGGKMFAQRFREQWTDQVSFFERHGFVVQRRDPIYALDLRIATDFRVPSPFHVDCAGKFCWEDFQEISAACLPAQQLSTWKEYFQTVDFDFAVKVTQDGMPVAYLGVAIRCDTGFAELVAVTVQPSAVNAIVPCLAVTIDELRRRNAVFFGTKQIPNVAATETLMKIGFEKVSEELLLSKEI
jgi:hypothetical protein